MADYTTNTAELTAIADAIRAKTGTSNALTFPNGFANAVSNIKLQSQSHMIQGYVASRTIKLAPNEYIEKEISWNPISGFDESTCSVVSIRQENNGITPMLYNFTPHTDGGKARATCHFVNKTNKEVSIVPYSMYFVTARYYRIK